VLLFLLGALVVFIPSLVVILNNKKSCTGPNPPPAPPEWNASDYQSNSDYYQNVENSLVFTQLDNLRLDRLSWPRFCPDDGSQVMYLRKQYHMPDINGSSTTLHWVNVSDPFNLTTVQLTRPLWGINDQQVRTQEIQ
jgi:hypothetical protein